MHKLVRILIIQLLAAATSIVMHKCIAPKSREFMIKEIPQITNRILYVE